MAGKAGGRATTSKDEALRSAPPLRGRQRSALRACALTPGGLRLQAYPSVMPVLVRLGFVEERVTIGKGGAWFLTPAGRAELVRVGPDER